MLPSHISETEILNTDLRKKSDREKWLNRPVYNLDFVKKEKQRLKKKYYRERKKLEDGETVNPARKQVMKKTGRFHGTVNNKQQVTEPETEEPEADPTKPGEVLDGLNLIFYEVPDEVERLSTRETVYSVEVIYRFEQNESYTLAGFFENKKTIREKLLEKVQEERPDITSPGGAPVVNTFLYENNLIYIWIDEEIN